MDALPPTPPPSNTSFRLDSSSDHSYYPPKDGLSSSFESDGCGGQNLVVKPKQSKSRNGCVTCKAKRLKCDELKPTCQQCQKRGVPCGGYKKEFKWRSFEESTIVTKSLKNPRKGGPTLKSKIASAHPHTNSISFASCGPTSSNQSPSPELCIGKDPTLYLSFGTPNEIFNNDHRLIPTPPHSATLPAAQDLTKFATPPTYYSSVEVAGSPPTGEIEFLTISNGNGSSSASLALCNSPQESKKEPEGGIEGIMSTDQSQELLICSPSPIKPTPSMYPLDSISSRGESFIHIKDIFRRPALTAGSSEILLSHFDKHTCGIMSLKDGPRENPWRTLIWPMARSSPALYHAISAMTAFHMSRERKELRVEGMEHMRKSIRFLAQGLSHGNIKQDAALGTTLVLAFSEAFDRHTSSGFQHLRGARGILTQALTKTPMMSGDVQRFKFLYNVWIYLDVLAGLTSNGQESRNTSLGTLHGPFTQIAEIDPLLGCAASLFPLIGKAASIVHHVRRTTKNSAGIITEAMQLQTQLEGWLVGDYYKPPEDPSNEVLHCVKTAEAYRLATLLYLHQAVPEIPSQKSHELAEKVIVLIASIPVSSRSCIVHIYPLLAAGCEAIGDDERKWTRNRWDGMRNRLWIGNVDKAWTVTKEVWDRRDRFQAQHQHNKMQLDYQSALPLSSSYKYSTIGVSSPCSRPTLTCDISKANVSWDPVSKGLYRTQLNFDDINGEPLEVSSQRRAELQFEYETSVRGKLHWLGVMKDWNWEVLLG